MSTKSTTATPRPKPSARPIAIEDAARKRRERELDVAIERVRPAMARADAYYRQFGIDPAAMCCSAKALAIWNGPLAVAVGSVPRKFFL
jgi:hypothetical protein